MMKNKIKISVSGYCHKCKKEHFLSEGNARKYCEDLIEKLDESGRLDFELSEEKSNPKFSTDYLFGKARGQMFGMLECLDQNNKIVILKAFSGQYNGIWKIKNWVPPLPDVDKFNNLIVEDDKKIKAIGKRIEFLDEGSEKKDLIKKRKTLSQNLLKNIYNLYELNSFSGKEKSLAEVFGSYAIPTGTGDCCAPKLLNYAAKKKLKPVSLAEFFYGKENLSGSKEHKTFYPSCKEKCYPILGYFLCGISDEK